MVIRIILALMLLQCLACGPIGPLPGGRLTGELGPANVADWEFVAELETAQLESNPSEPHSVNTWFISMGENLYVPTSMISGSKSPTKRSWVTQLASDPRVRIRLGSMLYERVAERVTDAHEFEQVREALEAKYGIAPSDRDPDREIWIFRLDPRVE